MYLTFSPPILPLLLSALVGLALAVYAWQQRPTRGAVGFMCLGLSVVLLSLPAAFTVAVAEPDYKVLGYQLTYPGLLIAPGAWLGFILRYTGTVRRSGWLALALAIEPIIVLILAATNGQHGLVWQAIITDPESATGLSAIAGPVASFVAVYAYSAGALGVAVLGWKLHRRRGLPWRQIGGLGLALAVAGIGESPLFAGVLGSSTRFRT